MNLNLEDCSPSGTVTYKAYEKIQDKQSALYKLRKVAGKNLHNTLRILIYNKALQIPVYRLTSKLIPLATHPALENWDYIADFSEELREIGNFIKQSSFRVSAHPDHFTVINSPRESVFKEALKDLDYHVKLFEAMGLDTGYKLVLHTGGIYGSKTDSMKRFRDNFERLPKRIRDRIILENDDRSYDTLDVLELCRQLKIPMVLDIHHHNCLCAQISIRDILPEIFDTWKGERFAPKVHFSSAKSEKDFRSHADFINYNDFTAFLSIASELDRDFDIMLEAKSKDTALIKLSDELAAEEGVERVGKGVFFINS